MRKFLLFFLVLNFLILPFSQIFAQELKYPSVPGSAPPTKTTLFPEYVRYLFNLAIRIGGIIALLVFIWSGFLYLTSTLDPAKREEAKKKMGEALFGLLLLICIYLILATINPQFLTFPGNITSPPPVVTSSPPVPPLPTKTFEEIPLGTLIEDLLGKNISCFATSISATSTPELVDCKTGNILAPSSSVIYSPTTSFYYCYDYDGTTPTTTLLSTFIDKNWLADPSFETGLAGWTGYGPGDHRRIDTATIPGAAHDGNWSLLTGFYFSSPSTNGYDHFNSPTFTVPLCDPKLEFWYKFEGYDSCPFDYAWVDLYYKEGGLWKYKEIFSYCYSGHWGGFHSTGWRKAEIDLTPYAGKTAFLIVGTKNLYDSLYKSWTFYDEIQVTGVGVVSGNWKNWTGNKTSLLVNNDRFDCIERLVEAIFIKSAQLQDLVQKLALKMCELESATEQLKDLAHNCSCSYCRDPIHCCPCHTNCGGGGSCPPCSCPSNDCDYCCDKSGVDPCPDRDQMNDLRENVIPPIIEDIEKLRIEICSLIYGASSTDCTTTYTVYNPDDWGLDGTITKNYYNQPTFSNGTLLSTWDVSKNPQFLTIQEALDRLNKFITDFGKDLSNLDSARRKMEEPYGDRLTLMEFYREKHKANRMYVNKNSNFRDYFNQPIVIDRYCYKFECESSTLEGLCVGCSLNSASSVCAIFSTVPTTTLYYLYDGDPATFYLHSDNLKERFVGQKVKIKYSIDVEEGEAGFIKSLIPIGETADEAGDLGHLIKSNLEKIYNNLNEAKTRALSARDAAGRAIDNAWDLIDMTSQGDNDSQDCVDYCRPPTHHPLGALCHASCVCYDSRCCSCCNPGPDSTCSPKYRYYYHCGSCSGSVCPFGSIDSDYNHIYNEYQNILNLLAGINTNLQNIIDGFQRFYNLTRVKNLQPEDPNRCTILHKLAISRERLKKCITGYGISYKRLATEERVISCEMVLDLTQTGIIALSPLFPYPPSSTCLNCYPYNSKKLSPHQKQECLNNRFTQTCESAIHDLTNNFYCLQKAQQ